MSCKFFKIYDLWFNFLFLELSCDDIILRESLFSFFADLLKRLGPVKAHSLELQVKTFE